MSASTAADASKDNRVSRWEDVVDILYAPSRVFARRENDSAIWHIVMIAALSAWLFFAQTGVLQSVFDADMARELENAPAEIREFAPGSAMSGMMRGIQAAVVFVTVPIFILLFGCGLWIAGRAIGSKQRFRSAVVVAAYAYVPIVLQQAFAILQGLVLNVEAMDGLNRVSVGPARFLDPDTTSDVVLAFAGAFDVFVLWQAALLAIGLSVTGRVPRLHAALAAAAVWAIAPLLGALAS